MSKQVLGRGAIYIYIQLIVSAISAFVFWFIISHLTNSVVVGTLSTIVSLSEILTGIAIVGIPDGIQRFLGKTFAEKRTEDSKIYIASSFFFLSIGIIISTLIILVGASYFNIIAIDLNLKIIIILVVISNAIQLLLNSVVVSSLKTKSLPIVNIISSVVKIGLSILLAILGSDVLGLTISYILVGNLISAILLVLVTKNLLKSMPKNAAEQEISFTFASKSIIIAGLANWLPMLVATLGYQLGTIVLFGSTGSSDAAVYFIALNVVNMILLGTTSLFTIALPALSSIQDGRKRLAWQTIRWNSLLAVPLSCSFFFYSKDIMRLFGESYVTGETSLQILLLSLLPTVVAIGISNLVFSYGNYRKSLAIDLAMNITRVILYFVLIPIYGPIGGAASFTIGSLLAFVVSILVIIEIKMTIFWKDLILVFCIPLSIGFLLYSLQFNYIVGIIVTIVVSYVLLLKLHTISISDVNDAINLLPVSISSRILTFLKKIKD